MPSKSLKQHQLMLAVSKDKELADKLNIDQSVAKEFIKKDEEAGLYSETSLESFDSDLLEQEDLTDLIPSSEEIEVLLDTDGDGEADTKVEIEPMEDDETGESGEEDEYSEESHREPEKPFRFDDRFES